MNSLLELFPPDLPEGQRVLSLFWAKWAIGAIRPVVQLNVPDLLDGGRKTAGELAAETGADPDVLYRILRAVAVTGVLSEHEDGTFSLAPFGAALRSGAPGGVREMFLFASDPMMWRPHEDLLHTARTTETAFDHLFGMSFFDYLKANPAAGALFDQAMRQNNYPGSDRVLAEYDFGRFRRIADVGGGKGQFLAEVLARHPECTGVLCDQPQVVVDAKEIFERGGVADRVTIVPVDFFVELPKGCDAYFIKHTLHNWDDEHAEKILRRVRDAIGDDSSARLLIVDMLLAGRGEFDLGKLIDMEMLSALGGRERSRAEWNRVAAAAGFEPVDDPAPGNLVLLEFKVGSAR